MAESFLEQFRKIERQVAALPEFKTRNTHAREERDAIDAVSTDVYQLRQVAGDVIAADSYSVRDTSHDRGLELMVAFREHVITASQMDLIGAADVAQLTSALETAWANLEIWLRSTDI